MGGTCLGLIIGAPSHVKIFEHLRCSNSPERSRLPGPWRPPDFFGIGVGVACKATPAVCGAGEATIAPSFPFGFNGGAVAILDGEVLFVLCSYVAVHRVPCEKAEKKIYKGLESQDSTIIAAAEGSV